MVKWLAKIIIFCKLLYIFYVDGWATGLERLPAWFGANGLCATGHGFGG